MRRRDFLKGVGLSAAALTLPDLVAGRTAWGKSAGGKQPNILVIVSDDMGYADLGCYGGKEIATPHIDSIAEKGVRFTNGYVSCPVCSPTRAGLITGRYQQRFGYYTNAESRIGLPLTEKTLADVLKASGYVTGAVGKWHLGAGPDFHPCKRGFDEFFGFLGGSHSYIDPQLNSTNPILRGTEPFDEREYLTDALTREAISFIRQHRDERFFLYLAYNAVHAPLQAPPRHRDSFAQITEKNRRTYAGMLAALDEGIGKVLAQLRQSGLEKDTLLLFINDNGGAPGNASDNGPLRDRKGTVFEGGIRVPFMVQWPHRFGGGQTYEQPVVCRDIFATAVAAAGADLPPNLQLDGVDLVPYLTGQKKTPPHQELFWDYGENGYAVRKGNYKLVKTREDTTLFDLSSDSGEASDLKEVKPDIFGELQKDYKQWRSQMPEALWVPKRAEPKQKRKDKKTRQ
jgi:arylsulfatase A-like enzyme